MTRDEALTVLGLGPVYTWQELAVAYRVQARRRHPDQGGTRDQWDELEAAKAVLTQTIEIEVPSGEEVDAGAAPSIPTGPPWWRRLARHRRLVAVIASGAALPLLWWWLSTAYPPLGWQVPVAVVGYFAAWWVYWLVREAGLPAVARATSTTRFAYFWPDAGLGAQVADALERENKEQ